MSFWQRKAFRQYCFAFLCVYAQPLLAQKCLFISSYHHGYAWSDGLERGLKSGLKGVCEIDQFDMDTKRRPSEQDKRDAAKQARAIIEESRPDIVIVADDNAVKYVLTAYYRDAELPFVFCGVNWTAEEYGLPYRNATGIIEVAPVRPLFKYIDVLAPGAKRGIYIGANTVTEKKNYHRFSKLAREQDIELTPYFVNTMREWIDAYGKGQSADFLLIGSNAGIGNWDQASVLQAIEPKTRKLTLTNHGWMMPYTMLGLTKIPEEQGELAARFARSILSGTAPSDIYIIPNRRWDIWLNRALLKRTNIALPTALSKKAKNYE